MAMRYVWDGLNTNIVQEPLQQEYSKSRISHIVFDYRMICRN
jgi:hypothetical protein